MANRVVHFELGVQNPERAAGFYRDVFGWQFKKWEGPMEYWLAMTGPDGEPGINGGIMRHQDGQPRTVNTIGVESVDAACEKVKKAGGTVVVEKMAIPGVGYLAYCVDLDGVLFGVHEHAPDAK